MISTSTSKRADLKRVLKLKAPEEALRTLFTNIKVNPTTEIVPVEESAGRVLAEDIKSLLNIPPYTRAFMDGYAVHSEDTKKATPEKPASLKVIGKIFPSDFPTSIKTSSHQTVYVACGGPIPDGANAVIKVEETISSNGYVKIKRPVEFSENIAWVGEEIKKDEQVLKKGLILRPQDIALLIGIGMRHVKVTKKPRLAIISVGDEIAEIGKTDPTKIVNNYATLIAGLALEAGATPLKLGVVPDNLAMIKDKIKEAINKAELVATIGGCSMGIKDFVPDAINALGSPGVIVHGVTLKPGYVAGAGAVNGKAVIMLPGHAVSTVVSFYLFVMPLINMHLGLNSVSNLPVIKAKLNRDIEGISRHTFIRVSIKKEGNSFIAEPVHGGSNVLTTLVKANGFTFLPPLKNFEKGEELEFTLFSRYEYAHLEH